MKDSQHSVETQEAPRKYIKANNERFSTHVWWVDESD